MRVISTSIENPVKQPNPRHSGLDPEPSQSNQHHVIPDKIRNPVNQTVINSRHQRLVIPTQPNHVVPDPIQNPVSKTVGNSRHQLHTNPYPTNISNNKCNARHLTLHTIYVVSKGNRIQSRMPKGQNNGEQKMKTAGPSKTTSTQTPSALGYALDTLALRKNSSNTNRIQNQTRRRPTRPPWPLHQTPRKPHRPLHQPDRCFLGAGIALALR